jgi:hypothetical protein
MTTWKVFKFWLHEDDTTTAGFTTDSDWDDAPIRSIGPGADAAVTGYGLSSPSHVRRGILKKLMWRLNYPNAVTYRLVFYDDRTGGDQTYQQRARVIFDSDEVAAACADDVPYVATELDRPFNLEDVGDYLFNIDWSAAPGNTLGYIMGWGIYEALDN